MNDHAQLVLFLLDQERYALPLQMILRTVRAVEITPLPDAPALVLGVINVEGDVLPVLNMRRRLRLPERAIRIEDHFLIAQTERRRVVLAIDEVRGVISHPFAQIVDPAQITPGLEQIQGVIQLEDGLVLIQNLERFLSLGEEHALEEALQLEVTHGV